MIISRYSLVLLSMLTIAGCKEIEPTEQEVVIDALEDIAPAGGSGSKVYRYANGEPMQVLLWEDYKVKSVRWMDLDGRLLLHSVPQQHRFLAIELNDNGEITCIYESLAFVKDGAAFDIKNGSIASVQRWDFGELVSNVDFVVLENGESATKND